MLLVSEISIKKICASMKNIMSCSVRLSVFIGVFHINNFHHFCLTFEFDGYVNAIISTTWPSCQRSLSDVFDNVLRHFVAHW